MFQHAITREMDMLTKYQYDRLKIWSMRGNKEDLKELEVIARRQDSRRQLKQQICNPMKTINCKALMTPKHLVVNDEEKSSSYKQKIC